MGRATWGLMMISMTVLACGEGPQFEPFDSNFGSSATLTGGGSASGGGTETGAATETGGGTGTETEGGSETGEAGCDPFADPELECGPMMRCDFETLTCVASDGTALVDDVCATIDDCSPGLVCFDSFCAAPCDPSLDDPGCGAELACAVADAPVPGACLRTCGLIGQDCATFGQACNLGIDGNGDPLAICTGNPGAGLEGEACEFDGDCDAFFVCTPADLHSFMCENNAESCCAALCDIVDRPCGLVSFEPTCFTLGIEGQETAGYCVGNP